MRFAFPLTLSLCSALVAACGSEPNVDAAGIAAQELTIGQADVSLTSYGPAEGACGVTVCYAVTGKRKPEVSHFVVGTPSGCDDHVVGLTVNGVATAAAVGDHSSKGSCEVHGIKLDRAIAFGERVDVCVTYDRNYPQGTVEFSVKAGTGCAEGTVAGPTCDDHELCDGVDQDCDGSADEDYAGLGDSCAEGVGACRDEGINVCGADKNSVVCDAEPAEPTTELCGTGIDEDCDAETDEGFDVGQCCFEGVGACEREGLTVCTSDGLATECNAVPGEPTTELCGTGIDEDCDAETDEGFDVGDGCTDGIGACARDGEKVCTSDGLATECNAVPGEPCPEICGNGIDENCNGVADDGFDVGDLCSVGTGACQADGYKVCAADGSGTVCDAVAGTPGAELCGTGIDEDCDGATDEGFEDANLCCFAGEGECAAEGLLVCAADGLSLVCNALPGEPSDEVCDGLDNDCDGAADEDVALTDLEGTPTVEVGQGNITLVSYTFDVEAETTTACYSLTSDAQPEISHFTEGTIASCDDALLEVVYNDADQNAEPQDFDVPEQNCAPIHGVKIDQPIHTGETGTLCLTYAGFRQMGKVAFQVKAGEQCTTGEVDGVGCEDIDPCAPAAP